jgi:hypothetical protein
MNSCFCYPYNQHTPDDPKFCPINKFIHSGNPCDVCYKYDTDELIILNYMGALHFMDNSTKIGISSLDYINNNIIWYNN